MTYEEAINILNGCVKTNKTFELEAKTIAVNAIKKQIPKKPIPHIVKMDSIKIGNGIWHKGTTVYKCPSCGTWLSKTNEHCNKCGQVIDWSDAE